MRGGGGFWWSGWQGSRGARTDISIKIYLLAPPLPAGSGGVGGQALVSVGHVVPSTTTRHPRLAPRGLHFGPQCLRGNRKRPRVKPEGDERGVAAWGAVWNARKKRLCEGRCGGQGLASVGITLPPHPQTPHLPYDPHMQSAADKYFTPDPNIISAGAQSGEVHRRGSGGSRERTPSLMGIRMEAVDGVSRPASGVLSVQRRHF